MEHNNVVIKIIEPSESNDDQISSKSSTSDSSPKEAKAKNDGVSSLVCALTLVGTRLGGGVVGLPFAIKTVGFLASIIFMIGECFICFLGFYLLLKAKDLTKRKSFTDIGMKLYGHFFLYLLNVLIALCQLGYPIIFFIVFGDISGALIAKLGMPAFFSSRWFTHSMLGILMLYLILKKEIQQLKYTNIALFFIVGAFLIIFFAHWMVSKPNPDNHVNLLESKPSIPLFAAIPTLLSLYGFNPAFFGAYNSLKTKSNSNGMISGVIAVLICFTVYSIVPIIAYRLYGHEVSGNMIANLAQENGILPLILQLMFLVIAIIHIPVIFFFGKESVLIIFDEITRHSYTRPSNKVSEDTVVEEVAPQKEEKADLEAHPHEHHELSTIHDTHHVNDSHDMHDDLHHIEISHIDVGVHDTHNDIKNTLEVPRINIIDHHEPNSSVSHSPNNGRHSSIHLEVPTINYGNELKVEKPTFEPNPKAYLTMKPVYYYTITLACYFLVVLLSIVVGDVTIFFGLIGTLASPTITFIFPGSFYLLALRKHKVKVVTKFEKFIYAMAWMQIMMGFGVLFGLGTAVQMNNFGY